MDGGGSFVLWHAHHHFSRTSFNLRGKNIKMMTIIMMVVIMMMPTIKGMKTNSH